MNAPTRKLRPKQCAWEVTLACNAACLHCGSSAGAQRACELGTAEALALVDALADLGLEKVTLTGGEPLLRRDWPLIAERLSARGVACGLISNGLLVADHAEAIAAAGFRSVGLSVDGPEEIHDELRRVSGGFSKLAQGARALRSRGVLLGAVTQVNRRNRHSLRELHDILVSLGFEGWQVQLTMPHGRAAREEALCLTPEELPALEDDLIALRARSSLFLQAADNIGYMSRAEPRLRSGTRKASKIFGGCSAGITALGITSEGTVRGCLSLPSSCDEGNVRDRSLAEIWDDPNAFAYNRRFRVEELRGACNGCTYGRICRGGCRSLAFAHHGSFAENTHCLHALAGRGDDP